MRWIQYAPTVHHVLVLVAKSGRRRPLCGARINNGTRASAPAHAGCEDCRAAIAARGLPTGADVAAYLRRGRRLEPLSAEEVRQIRAARRVAHSPSPPSLVDSGAMRDRHGFHYDANGSYVGAEGPLPADAPSSAPPPPDTNEVAAQVRALGAQGLGSLAKLADLIDRRG